jgi:hypothetical protein
MTHPLLDFNPDASSPDRRGGAPGRRGEDWRLAACREELQKMAARERHAGLRRKAIVFGFLGGAGASALYHALLTQFHS